MLCQQATFFFVTVLPKVLSKDSNYLSVSIAYAIILSILSVFKKNLSILLICVVLGLQVDILVTLQKC